MLSTEIEVVDRLSRFLRLSLQQKEKILGIILLKVDEIPLNVAEIRIDKQMNGLEDKICHFSRQIMRVECEVSRLRQSIKDRIRAHSSEQSQRQHQRENMENQIAQLKSLDSDNSQLSSFNLSSFYEDVLRIMNRGNSSSLTQGETHNKVLCVLKEQQLIIQEFINNHSNKLISLKKLMRVRMRRGEMNKIDKPISKMNVDKLNTLLNRKRGVNFKSFGSNRSNILFFSKTIR